MTDDREKAVDELTFTVMQGLVRGESLRSLVRYVFHEGARWRFEQPDVQAAFASKRKETIDAR